MTHPERTIWSKPLSIEEDDLRFESRGQYFRRSRFLQPRRMVVLENTTDVTGISICWDQKLNDLFFHRKGDQVLPYEPLNDYTPADNMWLYIPLDEGEFLTEIWKQEGYFGHERPFIVSESPFSDHFRCDLMLIHVLQLGTSKGRLTKVGFHLDNWRRSPDMKLIYQAKEPGHRIYYEKADVGVLELAFESQRPDEDIPPQMRTPDFTPPGPWIYGNVFFSSAVLDGVIEVFPCRTSVRGGEAIVGLLLIDSEGNRSCVGQIRLDCLESPIRKPKGLRFNFEGGSYGYYIRKVESFADLERRNERESSGSVGEEGEEEMNGTKGSVSFDCEMKGRLEWWFTAKDCQIHHNGRASPAGSRANSVYWDGGMM